MSEQHKKTVITFLTAMGNGDTETAAGCLAPDAITSAKGFGKFAGIRHYDTIVGTIGAFKVLFPDGLHIEVKSVTAEGDRVAIEFEGKATSCAGTAYNNQYCMVFTFANDKIKQVNEYFCNILADEVLWPLVEKMTAEAQQN